MKKKCVFLIVFIYFVSNSFSQKETEKWYYAGSPAPAIDFSSGAPVSLNNSGITFSWESGSSLADANGNLLFYADGNSVCFNRNHVAMANGTGITMQNSVTQGCIFVPKPGSATIYYLFHIGVPNFGNPPFSLYYSEIDITLSAGLGAITANKNIPIVSSFGNCAEKMTVTKHCNGVDYWLMVHSYTGNTFRAYLITATGINTNPVVTNIGANYLTQVPATSEDAIGQMKFSPNGTKLAVMVAGQKIVELYDFNKNTGIISNLINLGNAGSDFPYGVEFSHDNTKVYACGSSNFGSPSYLKQWNLSAGNAAAVIASGTNIANNISASSMQMAPDGKIYGAKFATNLFTINNPNVTGTGCGFVSNGFSTAPGSNQLGLPNFITSYFHKPSLFALAAGSQINATGCQNNGSATVTISSAFGVGPFTYSWSNNTIDGPTINLSSTISNLSGGNYSVIITDAVCQKDTVYFTISGGGTLPPVVYNISKCNAHTLPDGTTVFASGTYTNTIPSPGGCDSIIISNVTILPNSNGSQNINICSNQNFILPDGTVINTTGTYTTTIPAANGCDSVVTTSLNVSLAPIAGVSPNITVTLGSSVILTATGGSNYTWFPSTGLNNTNSNTVTATPQETIVYCVAVGVGTNGCVDTACVTISIETPCSEQENFKIPNAFSPNNDGINDEFCLQGWDSCLKDFSIRIYDRWGTKVFESKDPNFCWDGKYAGAAAESAVFVYYLSAKFKNVESVINKNGNISLMR